jgi:hypothetical protein
VFRRPTQHVLNVAKHAALFLANLKTGADKQNMQKMQNKIHVQAVGEGGGRRLQDRKKEVERA